MIKKKQKKDEPKTGDVILITDPVVLTSLSFHGDQASGARHALEHLAVTLGRNTRMLWDEIRAHLPETKGWVCKYDHVTHEVKFQYKERFDE